MSHVVIPAVGTGDTTPQVSTDLVSSAHYQYVKLADGTVGGSQPAIVDTGGNVRVAVGTALPGVYVGASVGNFPANIGSVAIANTPTVSIASTSISVGVSVANFPVNIGSVTNFMASAYPGIYFGASVANFPATQNVAITGQPVVVNIGSIYNAGSALGASITNFPANQTVTVSGQPISVTGSVVNYGGSITIASAVPGIFIGASLSNAGALSAASQVVVGGSITLASAVPGIFIGASISNQSAAGAASQVVVGGSITIASMSPGLYLGASVANFPANQTVTVSGQPISVTGSVVNYGGSVTIASMVPGQYGASVSNFPATQTVAGNVTASVIGYVGASIAGGTLTASVVGYIGASVVPGASVNAFNVGGSTIAFPGAAPVAGLGASPYHFISGASFNSVNLKGSAGTVYTVAAMNVNAAARYLRLFDKATQPSPGTDIPRQTYVIPGNAAGAGAVIPQPVGLNFAAGIGFDITGGSMGDTDQTITALGDVALNISYS